MRVLVVCTYDYWKQDHLWIANEVFNKLKSRHNNTDLAMIPFLNLTTKFIDQAIAIRGLSLNQADKIISFGPFSHLLEHNNKLSFLTSHAKEYYELWQSPIGEIANDISISLRNKINHIDLSCLSESRKVYCFYDKIKERHPELPIKKLLFPKIDITKSHEDKNTFNENFILCLGDFSHQSHFHLLTKSISKLHKTKLKFILAGRLQRRDIYDSLAKIIEENSLKDVIELKIIKNSSHFKKLINVSNMIVDCSIENDTYPFYLIDTLKAKKPFCVFTNSGLSANDFFSNQEINIITPTYESIKYFFENINEQNIYEYFKSQFKNYIDNYHTLKTEDFL